MKNNDNKQPSVEGENSNAKYFSKWQKYFVAAFFIVVWVMLAFYESALLERIDAQSLFLYDTLFFKEMMSVPAGLLSYVGAFFTQFLAIPVAGATIFVALLFALYKTVKRVFAVSDSNSLWALLPSVLLLALNVQFGYWIFYIKFPGWYFVPLLGTLFSLFAIECYRKLSWKLSLPVILLLAIFGYPLFGVYAFFAALCMSVAGIADSVKAGNNKLLIFKGIAPAVLAVILSVAVPYAWYYVYQSVIIEFMYTAGLPGYSWDPRREFTSTILTYWLPYMLLFVSLLLYSALCTRLNGEGKSLRKTITMLVVALLSVAFVWFYWYKDCNFRIETQHLRLHLEKSTAAGIVIKGKNGVYTLLYGPETDFGCKDTQQTLHRGITAAVLHRAKEILPLRLQQLSGQHNLHCKKITVRNTSTHWGSCSSSGTISLNLHLILLPQHLIDYVILHELCHTVEMNHSPRFWALLDELCDTDSKRLRAELKSYKGNIL